MSTCDAETTQPRSSQARAETRADDTEATHERRVAAGTTIASAARAASRTQAAIKPHGATRTAGVPIRDPAHTIGTHRPAMSSFHSGHATAAHPAHAGNSLLAAPASAAAMFNKAVRRWHVAPRPSWVALIGSAVAAGLFVWWIMLARQPEIDADSVIRNTLSNAEQAAREGHYSDPPERSALHYYSTVLALDPANAAAKAGVDGIADHYIDDAKHMIMDRQFAQAALTLEKVRRIRPEHRRLPLLDAQLRKQLKELLVQARETSNVLKAAEPPPARRAVAAGSKPGPTRAAATPVPASEPARRAASTSVPPVTIPALEKPATDTRREPLLAAVDPAPHTGGARPASEAILPPEDAAASITSAGTSAGEGPDEIATAVLSSDTTAAGTVAAATTAAAVAGGDAGASSGAIEPPATQLATTQTASTQLAPSQSGSTELAPPQRAAAVTPPGQRKLLRFVQPEYPSEALMRGYEGWVDLAIDVTAAGVVLNPRVEGSSSGRMFNRAALAAVRQWRYLPQEGSGTSDPEHIQVRVQFKLDQ
jgi:TonB family protein